MRGPDAAIVRCGIQDYSFFYQRDIVPREAVDLTGDVSHSVRDADDGDEYESSSSAEEEEFQDGKSQTLSTLSEKANFLLNLLLIPRSD